MVALGTTPAVDLVEKDDELKGVEQIEKALEVNQTQRVQLDQFDAEESALRNTAKHNEHQIDPPIVDSQIQKGIRDQKSNCVANQLLLEKHFRKQFELDVDHLLDRRQLI